MSGRSTDFLAILALILSVINFLSDRESKELALAPLLSISIDATEGLIDIDNQGLGPAIIEQYATRVDGKCVRTMDIKSPVDAQYAFLKRIRDDFLKELKNQLPEKYKEKIKISQSSSTADIERGHIIGSGKSFRILDIKIINKLPPEATAGDDDFDFDILKSSAFEKIMDVRNIEVEYCSQSGKTCKVTTGGGDVVCLRKGRRGSS